MAKRKTETEPQTGIVGAVKPEGFYDPPKEIPSPEVAQDKSQAEKEAYAQKQKDAERLAQAQLIPGGRAETALAKEGLHNMLMREFPPEHVKLFEAISETDLMDKVSKYVTHPYTISTPPEKVKKRPDGFDYVSESYMVMTFKKITPLYRWKVLEVRPIMEALTVQATVELTDMRTGNTEVGVGAARIQISKEAKERFLSGKQDRIMPFDLVDYDKNCKSALTQARKNALRNFGIAADVYNKRDEVATDEEKERYQALLSRIPVARREMFKNQWKDLGAEYSDFLDKWERAYPPKPEEAQVTSIETEKPEPQKEAKAETKVNTSTNESEHELSF